MNEETENTKSLSETVRFYITALAVLVACFSSFAFLFLVPFVIDPAFSTLFAEYVQDHVKCVTTHSESKTGLSNCTWSSCREGCTREIFSCTQIYVNYMKENFQFLDGTNYTESDVVARASWDYYDAKLFPNVKGCGYPPGLNCSEFNEKYSAVGTTFDCFYSKIMPDTALTELDIHKVKADLIYAIAIPWSLFLGSILYLFITYLGMNRPDPKADEPLEVTASKASKEASNYSLRSMGKSINHGMNRLRGDADDKGEMKKKLLGGSQVHRRKKGNRK